MSYVFRKGSVVSQRAALHSFSSALIHLKALHSAFCLSDRALGGEGALQSAQPFWQEKTASKMD